MAKATETLRKIVKVDRKTFFNPSGWLDYQTLVNLNSTILDIIRSAFYLPKPGPKSKQETFEEAVKRHHLSKADLVNTRKTYKSFAILFVILGFLDLFYSFFLLFGHYSILGFILGIATTALFFGQAFRFDFWAFQIEKRHLGLTFNDWKNHMFGNTGNNK